MRPFIAILLIMFWLFIPPVHAGNWQGLDTEIDAYAEKSGASPGSPLFELEGDLPLFMFALAGTAAGFILGYNWRRLFKEKEGLQKDKGNTDD